MRRAYLRFCLHFGRSPVPATKSTIIMYTVFLARSLATTSIPGYLNIIKLMHLDQGLPDPLDIWDLKAVKRGINRTLGRPPKQKLPITPDLLYRMYLQLDKDNPQHMAFWAACLVAFFAFLRKSTLLPKSASPTDISKALCLSDASIEPGDSVLHLTIRHTKTIQFGQRLLHLPVASVPDSVLCPVTAVAKMLAQIITHSVSGNHPLFVFIGSTGTLEYLTYSLFIKLLRSTLSKCNVNVSNYSGHSFRRGGCSYAFRLGVSPMLIKLRGDWRSSAYERYVSIQSDQHLLFAKSLALSVQCAG